MAINMVVPYALTTLVVPGSAAIAGIEGLLPVTDLGIAAVVFATFLTLFAISLVEARAPPSQ